LAADLLILPPIRALVAHATVAVYSELCHIGETRAGEIYF
jgi:hypothetical protein